MTASPSIIKPARKTWFSSSAFSILLAAGKGFFFTGSDSPVNAASSISTCPAISTPSVGTLSPGCRKISSPTTSSSIGISSRCPLRNTLTLIIEASASSFWNDCSLLYSDHVATKVASTTEIPIPTLSYHFA